MNRNDVRRFLKNCPHRDLIDFMINRVNLSNYEIKILDYKIDKNYSDEKISELLDRSIEYTRKTVRSTFDKISRNWEEIIEYFKSIKQS